MIFGHFYTIVGIIFHEHFVKPLVSAYVIMKLLFIFAAKRERMKKKVTIIFMLLILGYLNGQDIVGQWNGTLKVPAQSLRLVLHIHERDSGYAATLVSLDQGAAKIPITEISFENNKLNFSIINVIHYTGILSNDSIKGLFKQSGATFPLILCKDEIIIEKKQRPQEPKKPYSYFEEDVLLDNLNSSGVTLAGTLTLPYQEGVFPAIILVSGSGAQNRDSEIFGHKPFLVIADYLTRQGFAVLRYDDRGTAASTGIHDTCSTYDFSTDAEAAFLYLQKRKDINPNQIGFIGHSEGGMIATMVAARNKDISSIILLAAPGIRGDSLLFLQSKIEAKRVYGLNEEEIEKVLNSRRRQDEIILYSSDNKQMENDLIVFFGELYDSQTFFSGTQGEKVDFVKQSVRISGSKFYQYFIKYDPASALALVKCPVLVLNGENDVQVPAEENLNAIQNILLGAGNTDVAIKKLPCIIQSKPTQNTV
ncbi:MAG: alpha/beta hydrolase [Bacteroidales bacterium]|nr:alpha/beta hydrolase [Bacteroidales bacterium]